MVITYFDEWKKLKRMMFELYHVGKRMPSFLCKDTVFSSRADPTRGACLTRPFDAGANYRWVREIKIPEI